MIVLNDFQSDGIILVSCIGFLDNYCFITAALSSVPIWIFKLHIVSRHVNRLLVSSVERRMVTETQFHSRSLARPYRGCFRTVIGFDHWPVAFTHEVAFPRTIVLFFINSEASITN